MLEHVLKFFQRKAYAIICSLLFLVAVFVRILAARGDFAMDEIWSLRLVTENAHCLTDIIFKITHDNNHILNSIWMYILGPQQVWQLYRIPAVIGGSLCVLFSFLIARQQSRAQGVAALVLVGFCFPLVFYSSEARGYGLMMGFIMIAFYAMQRLIKGGHPKLPVGYVLLFWSASVFGFLSHLIFVCAYMGLAAWSLHEFFTRKDKNLGEQCKDFLFVHSVPTLFFVFLYLVFVRVIIVGGGPIGSVDSALYQSLVATFGVWGFEDQARLLCVIFLVLVVFLTFVIRKFYGKIWVFFGVSIFCAPTFVLLFFPFPFVSIRHFLPSILLLIYALSYLIDVLWRKSPISKLAAAGIILLFFIGQLTFLPGFLRYGRGQFSNAVRYLCALSDSKPLKIASDFDFRNELVLNFYKERISNAAELQYVSLVSVKTELDVPDIFLIHFFQCAPWDVGCLPSDIQEGSQINISLNGKSYAFLCVRSFPWHGILSGWSWIVFQRDQHGSEQEARSSSQ